jgi:hypothetical protein
VRRKRSWIGSFQDFFCFLVVIDINGALFADAAAQGFPLLSDFVRRGTMKLEVMAILFHTTINDIPAWRQMKLLHVLKSEPDETVKTLIRAFSEGNAAPWIPPGGKMIP